MLDLDPLDRHAQLFGHDHRHDGLGARADVAGAHVQVDAAVGEQLDDHRRARVSHPAPHCGRHTDAAAQMPITTRSLARRRPPERPRAFPQTLSQPVAREGQSRARVGRVARRLQERREVLEPELDRVHPDLCREGVHHLLQRPGAGWLAGRPHGAPPAGVGVDIRSLGADVRAQVEVLDQVSGYRARRVGADVTQEYPVQRRQRAVTLHACSQLDQVGRSVAF